RVAAIHGGLLRSEGPRERQFAAEVMRDGPVRRPEDHIRYAPTFGAWQPRGDERIRCIDVRVDPQRPAGEKDGDDRYALPMQPAQQLQVRPVTRAVLDRVNV